MEDIVPVPSASNTFKEIKVAPEATPSTPIELFFAPIIPATCVPCPFSSAAELTPDINDLLLAISTVKSGWSKSIPVSIIHAVLPIPLP
jgi:hypothetical protein